MKKIESFAVAVVFGGAAETMPPESIDWVKSQAMPALTPTSFGKEFSEETVDEDMKIYQWSERPIKLYNY